MNNFSFTTYDLRSHKAKFLSLLDIKFALMNGPTHVKINDYDFDSHLSIIFPKGVQANILIDDELENIYFTTLLVQRQFSPELDLAAFNLAGHFAVIARDYKSWQLFSSINYSKKVNVDAVVQEILALRKSAEQLLEEYPNGFTPGILDEGNFEEFGDLTFVKDLFNPDVDEEDELDFYPLEMD